MRLRRSSGPVELPAARRGSGPADARFYFSFGEEESGQISLAELRRKGYAAELMPPDPPQDWTWGVVAGGVPEIDDLEGADKIFTKWAKSHGGDYDGHEVAVAADAAGAHRGPFSVAVTEDAVLADTDPTSVMRHSDFPFWVSLRQRLAQEGIDHKSTRVVASFEEPTVQEPPTAPSDFDLEEVGVLVTADGRVLEYAYSNRRQSWVAWADITESWREGRHAKSIETALTSREDGSS